jgi:ATP phosphoribosyltransferase
MARIIPTIDLYNGLAVIVNKGLVCEEIGDPFECVEKISTSPYFQVTDLNRAFGDQINNKEIIKQFCFEHNCYVAGGIRSYEDAIEFLNAGAKRVAVSTNSIDIVEKIDKNRLILSLDINENNQLLVNGRKEVLEETIFERIGKLHKNIELICITFHQTEGTNSGQPEYQLTDILNFMNNNYPDIHITVAGGINSCQEIKKLLDLGINPQFGYGIWKNIFTIGEAMVQMLNENKQVKWIKNKDNLALYPTIVQSKNGKILGCVYSSKDTLQMSIDSKKAIFYSRDSESVWLKGLTSENYFFVKKISFSCDRTSLVMVVEPFDHRKNLFCHKNTESCFCYRDPTSSDLGNISDYLQKIVKAYDDGNYSYTKKLIGSPNLLRYKLFEELQEFITANTENIISEAADLIYHLILYLIQNNGQMDGVLNELNRRKWQINKQIFKTIDRPKKFIIGLCLLKNSKHNDKFLNILEELGIHVNLIMGKSMEYESFENFIFKQINPKDVSTQIHNDMVDGIICYEDVIKNYPVDVVRYPTNNHHTTNIVVVARENFNDNFSSYPENYKFKIASEYKRLTEKWLIDKKITGKAIQLNGKAESEVIVGTCDMAVTVCDTGETLKQHNLKVVDIIGTHSIGLFIRSDKFAIFGELIKNIF